MLRRKPALLAGARAYYGSGLEGLVDFINHWCVTVDPRNAGTDHLTKMPFILFERQEKFVRFIYSCIIEGQSGLCEKARDMGATWLCVCVSVWLWLFWPGAAIGWGSRAADLVDKIGDPKSIFEKLRSLIRELPREFMPKGFADRHLSFMRIVNIETEASIVGEIGDNIGRGGRTLATFKDESAHYEHPEMIEAALGDNTNVQIDISSVNGPGNVFHRRREGGVEWQEGMELERGRVRVFVLDWRDHPEKDDAWYAERRKKAEAEGLLHILAQEVDRNYYAALFGVIIPADWVKAAIDADKKLGFDDSGGWIFGLDVADDSKNGDTNALCGRKGVCIKSLEEWGQKDTGETARRAAATCGAIQGPMRFDLNYDCIGVGAGVKSEANRLKKENDWPRNINLVPWNAGASVQNPEQYLIHNDNKSPKNEDYFANMKAQAWWSLRRRFELTYRAVTDASFTWNADDLISIPGDLPLLRKLEKELSQPTISPGSRMKMVVDKQPEGTRSPNLADSVVMAYFPITAGKPIRIEKSLIKRAQRPALMQLMRRRRFR